MTTFGLSSTGFRAKTTSEVLAELQDAVKAKLGAGVNVQSDSILGVLLAVFADRYSELWEAAQALYASLDSDQAGGAALDALCALTGTTRKAATKSTVTLSATGTPATVLASGRIASVAGAPTSRFVTTADATIVAATAWAPTTGYAVGDVRTNSSKIYRCITAGTSAGAGGPTGTGTDITDGTVHWRYLGDGTGYITVAAEAENAGPVIGNAYTVTTIVTPVSGWNHVTNILDAAVGANEETDAALRARRVVELSAIGAATVNSIQAALVKLSGVSDAVVFENNTDVVDGSGRPAHSVHAVIEQGTVTAAVVAAALLELVAYGIATHGGQSLAVNDSKGNAHTMKWDWATLVDIHVRVDVNVIAADFPSDGATQIKNAIVAYGDALPIGRDVVAEKIRSLVWAIPGVHDLTNFKIDIVTPPVASGNVTISPTQVADFDTSRITVNVTPVTPS